MERGMAKPNNNLCQQAGGVQRVAVVAPTAVMPVSATTQTRMVDVGAGNDFVIVGGERRNVVEVMNRGKSPMARTESEEEYEDDGIGGSDRKRKRFSRHTIDQVREMELLFRASHHPDEAQRREVGERMGLSLQQVKFWFQNRRTQSKNMQERHVNISMRNEMQLIKEENSFLRDAIKKTACFNCGFRAPGELRLRIENARLQDQVEKLQRALNVSRSRSRSEVAAVSATNSRALGLEMSEIMGVVDKAREEVVGMATLGERVWSLYMGNGRGVRNNGANVCRYRLSNTISSTSPGRCVELSKEFVIVYGDLNKLVQCFMDVNQWKDMFPSIISKATIVDVLNEGEGNNKDGAVQLMVAEFQMLTPMIPTREVHFIRHCKQLGPKKWAIVDLAPANKADSSRTNTEFKRRPSGCVIEDNLNGRCKVIWIDQMECDYMCIPPEYPGIVSSAFGAKHWAITLKQQCERLAFTTSANYYINYSNEHGRGFLTSSERTNIMTLAHKMTANFCQAIGKSSPCQFVNSMGRIEDNIKVSIRRNVNDPGEPIGVILCAVTSLWLPVSRILLFDYLKAESQKHEWDVMLDGNRVNTLAIFAKGPNKDNSVKVQTIKGHEDKIRLLQDSSITEFESMLVYASMEIPTMQSVAKGEESEEVRLLASGFSILRDGLDLKAISGERKDRGSLLTLTIQLLASNSPMEELTMASVDSFKRFVSSSLAKIMEKFKCE